MGEIDRLCALHVRIAGNERIKMTFRLEQKDALQLDQEFAQFVHRSA